MKKKRRFKKQLLYWISLGILNSLRLLALLPYPVLLQLGKGIGWILLKTSPSMVKNARINIELCFPNLSPTEKQQLLKKHFASLGMSAVETIYSGWAGKSRVKKLMANIHGLETFEKTVDAGEGVIILFPHLMSMYLAGNILGLNSKHQFSIMYHSPKNPALRKFMRDNLLKHVDQLFTRRDIKALIKHVRQGNIVWYAPDLDLGKRHSVFANFFGQPAATLVAPHRLARLTKAKVFTISFYRQSDGYDIALKPLEQFPSKDEFADIQRINDEVEAAVRPHPEQYLLCYQRFRTQPDGQSPYKIQR